jgi:uncharacterized protein YbbK (DUF523 family)
VITRAPRPVRVGVSACLLGDAVRYDGGHKRDAILLDRLGPLVEWVKVCPEVESGMGTPREPIQLVNRDGRVRLLAVKTGVDHTPQMTAYSAQRLSELAREDLCGYVLKEDSPSCGMRDVKVHDANGPATRSGVGAFAAALLARFPDLPVEDEGRLADAARLEHFIERIFAYRRLRDLFEERWTVDGLVRFHAEYQAVLMAHSPAACRTLDRLVARAASLPRAEARAQYSRAFMQALAVPRP